MSVKENIDQNITFNNVFLNKLNLWQNLKGKRKKHWPVGYLCFPSTFSLQLYSPIPCLWPVYTISSCRNRVSCPLPSGYIWSIGKPRIDQRKGRKYEQFIIYSPGFVIWLGVSLAKEGDITCSFIWIHIIYVSQSLRQFGHQLPQF